VFGIGETELVIIVVFAFLLFGPDKLPGMGRTLGRVLRQFREASDGFTEVVQTNIMDPASEELEKSPKQRKREEEAARQDTGADTGVESAEVEEKPVPKRETFAERMARLRAEREAAAAAAAASEPAEADEAAPAQDASAEVVGPAPEPKEEPAEPARTSAADLYAMGSQKSSRTLAKEAALSDASAQDATVASAQADADATSGEEAGSAEA
jgi:TatA/E family protein of Tat protein translocase